MTKQERKWLVRYEDAYGLHGFSGLLLQRAARLALRGASAATYEAFAGSQRKSKAWKQAQLVECHNRASDAVRALGPTRRRKKAQSTRRRTSR